jgi:hypothetical protein
MAELLKYDLTHRCIYNVSIQKCRTKHSQLAINERDAHICSFVAFKQRNPVGPIVVECLYNSYLSNII